MQALCRALQTFVKHLQQGQREGGSDKVIKFEVFKF